MFLRVITALLMFLRVITALLMFLRVITALLMFLRVITALLIFLRVITISYYTAITAIQHTLFLRCMASVGYNIIYHIPFNGKH